MKMQEVRVDDVLAEFSAPIRLGGGGQKQVYRATHPVYGEVAVKIGRYSSQSELERISREVGLLQSIDSPYFPKQFLFEPRSGSRFCIVEELISGQPLEHHLGDFNEPYEALKLIRHVVNAMSILWSRRVVHRDLKPANIIIAYDHPRIIDLGIARMQDATSLTLSFVPFGPCTPDYASPEQLTNQKRAIDHRSDQFTLGIVLAQLILRGTHPFDPSVIGQGGSIPERILQNAWQRDAIQAACSPGIFALVEKMLGSKPYLRFRRYQDLSCEISHILEGDR
ncbi:MAG: serine/threonine-protein kinase [Bacillota bacterium]